MTFHSHDDGRGKRIVLALHGEEHVLTVDRARELRDALTRELGEPQALTDREAMVWAAEFARSYVEVSDGVIAAGNAQVVVLALRGALSDDRSSEYLDSEACAMLAAMSGGGR